VVAFGLSRARAPCLAAALLSSSSAWAEPVDVPPPDGGVQDASPASLAAVPAEPERRGLPAPLDSPPFPSSDWVGPVIGTRDTSRWPLEKLLDKLFRDGLEGAQLEIYGWIEGSVNGSTSSQSNLPSSYDIVPNQPELNQLVLRIERLLDTVQTDRIDWGFRITSLFGTDYRFTTAGGWFSNQLLGNNNLYGYDAPELYVQLYVPRVVDGLVLTVGRYLSPPDIETQMAPANYFFTHSLAFEYDPYTFTGVTAELQLGRQWTVHLGVTAGADEAPWSNAAQPTGQILVRYVTADNVDSIWAGMDAIGSGQFTNGHDDLQVAIGTWGHRFSSTVHMMTEGYYMWQYDAVVGGTCIYGPSRTFANGGGCGAPLPGRTWELALVNYLPIKLTDQDYLTIRNELMDDPYGERSGYATWYTTHTLGWAHQFNDLFQIRPEIRYDRSYANGVTPYDDGTRKDQFTGSVDAIVRF
jgi:hypothetical protein